MIPISLYVTIELVKLGQVYFIQEDIHLYYEPAEKRIECRALNITEDLGQVIHSSPLIQGHWKCYWDSAFLLLMWSWYLLKLFLNFFGSFELTVLKWLLYTSQFSLLFSTYLPLDFIRLIVSLFLLSQWSGKKTNGIAKDIQMLFCKMSSFAQTVSVPKSIISVGLNQVVTRIINITVTLVFPCL